ncbi:maleylpyruvate isomerase family mycothiol-dependent enzyme [Isoptericola sp. 4D.3]|uniref:Maleylpyruvate isomerase family mycothiol-dependent enzyme n=1 Tax=Isoptericola peretonis TaxID=2918523 RepID=A0ABT0J8V8_9MICO|nr:maleylpyruvate isomerase family mycothiol-dependent enzyme [Isoptericola sp. 4D.3]
MPARTDLVTDPRVRDDLLLARRGTAFFSRKLGELTEAELSGPSRVPGWTRAHVVAHVGYHARALARVVEGVRTGVAAPMYPSARARDEELELGATLPAVALRHLHSHAAVHLDVEWRDLAPERWELTVALDDDGVAVPVAETPWRRAREVWLGALDLGTGAGVDDLPRAVTDRIAAVPA